MAWFRNRDRFAGTARITAEEVASARFTTTSFRAGYDTEDVDAFLADCVETLRWREGSARPEAPVSAKQVVDTRFGQTKFRAGYDQDEVDDLLDRVAATLHDAESVSDADGPSAGSAS